VGLGLLSGFGVPDPGRANMRVQLAVVALLRVVVGPPPEQHLAVRQYAHVDGNIIQLEDRVPSTHDFGIEIEVYDLIQALVFARRVVDNETEQAFLTLHRRNIDAAPLVFPGEPIRQG
jgi:hypothetical protein